jgi:hypothetical protein
MELWRNLETGSRFIKKEEEEETSLVISYLFQ